MLYPELETVDLDTLTRRLVETAGYSLQTFDDGLRAGDRSAQVSCGALERVFLVDLWSTGVCYGGGEIEDPHEMADAVGAFVAGRASVDEMERRFPWVRMGDVARAHEAGRMLDWSWEWRLETTDEAGRLLIPLLRACASRPRLRALFPFSSHDALLFSRTTGFPYESMPACGRPVFEPSSSADRSTDRFVHGPYEILRHGASLGIGEAEWAADVLEREVPAAWTRAVDGTADDHDDAYNEVFRAIWHEDADSLREAIAAGSDVNIADPRPGIGHMQTPLHVAAGIGNTVLARILLEAGARVDARCTDGSTPLMRARNAGALEVAKLLEGSRSGA